MIYRCDECNCFLFTPTCPSCSNVEGPGKETVPLDPAFYPEFQYQSKGLLADLFRKGKVTRELIEKRNVVLEKYREYEKPYFENFFHVGERTMQSGQDGDFTNFDLFGHVLVRLGFNELEELPDLLRKLVMTTSFRFLYRDFARRTDAHVKEDLNSTLFSWISHKGSGFRNDLVLLLYFLWQEDQLTAGIPFSTDPPLLAAEDLLTIRKKCEAIYLDILISRFQHLLERFDPARFVTIYAIDAMNGFQFEDFLLKLFTALGYAVQATKRTADQGADLFAEQFGRKVVIQAKNYSNNVGNSAVQQALAAKQFYSCDDAMVVTNSYFTRSARDLATAASIKLVDRRELQRYLDDYNRSILESEQH